MDRDMSRRGSSSCGGCLCLAFVLVLFATASPYWVWQRYLTVGWAVTTSATGSFVVSSLSGAVPCGWYTCVSTAQWNRVSDFNDTMCTGDFYTEIGQYGFCDGGLNGKFVTPSSLKGIQATMIISTILLFFASIAACGAPQKGGSKGALSAAGLSFLSMCFTCAAFATAASFDWYKHLLNEGGYLPYQAVGPCTGGVCLFMSSTKSMFYWGPGFTSTVVAFVITALATISLCAVSKNIDDDLDGGNNGGEYNAGEYNAGDYNAGNEVGKV